MHAMFVCHAGSASLQALLEVSCSCSKPRPAYSAICCSSFRHLCLCTASYRTLRCSMLASCNVCLQMSPTTGTAVYSGCTKRMVLEQRKCYLPASGNASKVSISIRLKCLLENVWYYISQKSSYGCKLPALSIVDC